MTDPFGWGGLPQAMPGLLRETLVELYGETNVVALETARQEPEPELQRELDAIEAERFRLELERDARGDRGDWPDGG